MHLRVLEEECLGDVQPYRLDQPGARQPLQQYQQSLSERHFVNIIELLGFDDRHWLFVASAADWAVALLGVQPSGGYALHHKLIICLQGISQYYHRSDAVQVFLFVY